MWQQFSNIYKSIPCKIPIVETTIAKLPISRSTVNLLQPYSKGSSVSRLIAAINSTQFYA